MIRLGRLYRYAASEKGWYVSNNLQIRPKKIHRGNVVGYAIQ